MEDVGDIEPEHVRSTSGQGQVGREEEQAEDPETLVQQCGARLRLAAQERPNDFFAQASYAQFLCDFVGNLHQAVGLVSYRGVAMTPHFAHGLRCPSRQISAYESCLKLVDPSQRPELLDAWCYYKGAMAEALEAIKDTERAERAYQEVLALKVRPPAHTASA
jgi:hypothetical protein